MTNYTPEQLEAAKGMKTPDDLISYAKEAGVELTSEEAEAFIKQRNQSEGKLADIELENIAGGHGGMCHKDGREVVTLITTCVHKLKPMDGTPYFVRKCGDGELVGFRGTQINCNHLSYEKGLWLCNYPENLKKK
jgi:predicted ribosomally synthesized peptide with nif11-like leader